jgi:hypothetical protein
MYMASSPSSCKSRNFFTVDPPGVRGTETSICYCLHYRCTYCLGAKCYLRERGFVSPVLVYLPRGDWKFKADKRTEAWESRDVLAPIGDFDMRFLGTIHRLSSRRNSIAPAPTQPPGWASSQIFELGSVYLRVICNHTTILIPDHLPLPAPSHPNP